MNVFVHLGFEVDAARHRSRFEAGLAPDVVPYGFHHAEMMGCKVDFSTSAPESRLMNLFRRGLQRLLGFDLIHAYRNRKKLFSSDVVWTMEERQYLAVLCLPFFLPKLRRPRLIGHTIWLFNDWDKFSFLRRWVLKKLLNKADCLTVNSKEYLPQIESLLPGKGRLLTFGVSADSFPWSDEVRERHAPIRIVALGNDRTRDWPTLLAAFGNDERFETVVVSRQVTDEMAGKYRNVSVPRDPSMREFLDLYRWADFVVIPMVKNKYSGITVAIEATRVGVPVICSATGGVPTYFGNTEVLYVAPEDPNALRNAVLSCSDRARAELVANAQRRSLSEDYSTSGMAGRYLNISRELMAR